MEGEKFIFVLVVPNSTPCHSKQQVVKRNDETHEFCKSLVSTLAIAESSFQTDDTL
jgi:hypothetical protein